MRQIFIAAILLVIATPATTQQCKPVATYDGDEVKLTHDGLVTFIANMDVNTDGALRSYKIDDLGFLVTPAPPAINYMQTKSALNIICNGMNIKTWSGDTVIYPAGPKGCVAKIAEFERIRKRGWVVQDENFVDFYAIALAKRMNDPANDKTDNRGIPCVKDGYYVSQTKLNTGSTKPNCDPDKWIDALRIPAIVLVYDKAMQGTMVEPGDLVLVRLPGTGRFIGAVFGDTNSKKIGEATVITAMKLRGITAVPPNYHEIVKLAIPGWMGTLPNPEYIVFPKTKHLVPNLSNNSFDDIQKQVGKLIEKHDLNNRKKLCN